MKKLLGLSLVLCSSLFLSACGVKENGSFTTTPSLEQKESPPSFSLRDLIAQNIPQKCTWSSIFDDSESSGSIIISGQKFNQKVTLKQDGVISNINSLSDGVYVYTWQETSDKKDSQTAFKMKLNALEDTDQEIPEAQKNQSGAGQSVDLDQKYQYQCSPTTVSDSDFQPPQNIEFIDYSQFLEDLQSNIPSIDLSDYQQ